MESKMIYKLLVIISFFMTSCLDSKYDYEKLFPEEYGVVFSIRNNDSETAKNIGMLSRLEQHQCDTVVLLKGGAYPDVAATLKIETWSEEEVQEYAIQNGGNYELLPQDAYSFESTEFFFDVNEYAKDLSISFNNSIITEYMRKNTGITYLLPIRLVSDKTVNETQKEIVIPISFLN